MYTGISANERKEGARNMEINEQNFGENYHLITITNQNGTSLSVSDLGARVVHFQTIIDNEKRELILGFDEAKEYLEKDPYIGASIGRMAGRITNGTFKLDDETFEVKTDPDTGVIVYMVVHLALKPSSGIIQSSMVKTKHRSFSIRLAQIWKTDFLEL